MKTHPNHLISSSLLRGSLQNIRPASRRTEAQAKSFQVAGTVPTAPWGLSLHF